MPACSAADPAGPDRDVASAEPLSALLVRAVDAPAEAGPDLARNVLRHELARWLEIEPGQVALGHTCRHCGGDDHGALVVPGGLWASLSRAPGLVVVAISDAGPVGVDVEAAAAADFAGFDGVALHPEETAATATERTTLWVRKEAVVKALGLGLRLDPRWLRVSAPGEPAAVLAWDSPHLAPSDPVWLDDLDVGPGHQAAVAHRG